VGKRLWEGGDRVAGNDPKKRGIEGHGIIKEKMDFEVRKAAIGFAGSLMRDDFSAVPFGGG